MSEDIETTTAEDDFVTMKKDEILDAVKKGNRSKAGRHAVEIIQYLGIDDNELPIEDQLEELE